MVQKNEIKLEILDTTKPDVGSRKGPSFTYPRWSIETKPYWDGCMRGELLFQRCGDCREVIFHPRSLCPYCLGVNLEWQRSSGRGKIYSFTLQHIPLHRERPGKLPRVVGIAELEEGFHMFTEFVIPEETTPAVNMPVMVIFDRVADDLTLPKFQPYVSARA